MKRALAALGLALFSLPVFSQITFTIGNTSDPETLDPQLAYGLPEQRIALALFENLVSYDPKTGDPVPGLAESWTRSADGLTWTFPLRAGAAWSDGTPITARTVVDSWLRVLDPATASPYAFLVTDVVKGAAAYNAAKGPASDVGFSAVDERTVQVTTAVSVPYLPDLMATPGFAIVPMHVVQAHQRDWTLPQYFVSNGPFTLKEWRPQARVVVQKNPRYWDAANVKVDQVVYLPVEDNALAYDMFMKGSMDWSANPPPADKLSDARKRPDYVVSPVMGTYYYEFNTTKPPFNDPRVRKSFAMAINRGDLLSRVAQAGQVPAFALTPPLPGRNPYTPPRGVEESVDKARKLLADAGYGGGKGFPKVRLLYNTNEQHRQIAEALRDRWQQTLGVTVELVNQEWGAFLQTRGDGTMGGFDIARSGWIADYRDPFAFLSLFLSSNTDLNDGRYNSPAFDQLLLKGNALAGGPARMKTFQDAEQLLIDQDMAVLPLYFYVSQNMVSMSKWGGWYPNVLDVHPLKGIFKK